MLNLVGLTGRCGPILAFSYLAAKAANAEPVKQATPTRVAAE